ncbi:malate synthase G [uncultured Amphritea sp.]|uniref:malate synthase G n=1 Tax=uncultured Amphritea sp. TaxID=981605 RepID=UPI00261792C5|nr:malate synthase G [uncultured Amphritea sp.]
MNSRANIEGLQISQVLYDLVADEICPGSGVSPQDFWQGYANIIADMAPVNSALLKKRDRLQLQLDEYHSERRGQKLNMSEYTHFLQSIGYLVAEGGSFAIETTNIDPELASIAGPQLVVPVNNARFALNAANARWGSLYDALYGSDAIGPLEPDATGFNFARAQQVIRWSTVFLDQATPLASGSHEAVIEYSLEESASGTRLIMQLQDGSSTTLANTSQFVGLRRTDSEYALLLENHGLHIELQIDPADKIGELSRAGVKDIVLESALSTIMDCEDSVTAVDADDKVVVYRNWLGLMKGDLQETFIKQGQAIQRNLMADRSYQSPQGDAFTLSGRSILLVRNVGHLMTTDAVLDADGNETPEGILDAMVTALCALHDRADGKTSRNSRYGSIYIVKPKMHGPEEVAFTDQLFGRVEEVLGLAPNTIKVGVMDEERRTSANLKESIRAVKNRLFFINTGFLDRTGDEIHTSMLAGAVYPKDTIKTQPWIGAYEDRNMDTGLQCGLQGKAQIGKGMWPMPDEMNKMLEAKQAHPQAGASCAWVPSPTAATLHAVHYHQIDVSAQQDSLMARAETPLEQLLTPPLLGDEWLQPELIQAELDNNAQSILGYVVRWVEQGVGCSKVPDINNVGLMEDRATLRISSQLLANWLLHGICTDDQVIDTLKRMAAVVDTQNAEDPAYRNMAPDFDDSVAFQAACDLIFKGCEQPNGYTEPVLHKRRREFKASHPGRG